MWITNGAVGQHFVSRRDAESVRSTNPQPGAHYSAQVNGPIRVTPRGRRLKGPDEFETPEFVGRMARVERRRRIAWAAMVAGAMAAGAGLGLVLF